MINKYLAPVLAPLLFVFGTIVEAAVPDDYADERALFIQARKAFNDGNLDDFKRLRNEIGNAYPIAHYLDFIELKQVFSEQKPEKSHAGLLNKFERDTKDKSLTKQLTQHLQRRAASEENWVLFDGLSKSAYAADMVCDKLQSQASAGKLKTFNEAALELWVEPKDHPERCAALLDELESRKAPPVAAIWERIYKSIDAKKPEYAESVLHYLGRKDQKPVKDWIAARKNPKAYLTSGALNKDTSFNRRALAELVLLWSKDDPVSAMSYWLDNYERYRFYNDRYYDTHRLLAMRGAYRRLPESYAWLNSVQAREDDLELFEWRVRSALYEQDWENLLRSLKQLPKEEQIEDHWAYWEARALEEMGKPSQATTMFKELSLLPTYYGFLAADKISADYAIKDNPIDANASVLTELQGNPGLIRAREYYQVNVPWEGRREWNAQFEDANPEKLAALAVLAGRWGLYDRAIFSAGRAEKKKALSTRFPVVYRSEVDRAAAKNRIPPAWVFGVMRRESAYIRDVRSSAGAVGLMQLMPQTAKYVAKLQGNKNWKGDLTDIETNIGFGTFYLRHVMDKFDDHQVLATASYNAGPKRVSIWLPPIDMPADVWIDSIPYTETRRYVRAVMAYTAIYEWHLTKKPARLSSKLKQVPAAKEGA